MFRSRWTGLLALLALVCVPAFAGDPKLWEVEGYWLPEAASTYSASIDKLFYAILYLTAFVFVATEVLLIYFVFKYRRGANGAKSYYTHGNHQLEMIWTLTPALILAVIAFVQKSTWDEIKSPSKEMLSSPDTYHVQLFAETFTWNFRYPGPDKKFGTKDDFITERTLTVPVNKKVVVTQTSKDVIHSFFLPYQRLKQDAVPGMMINTWFDVTKTTAEMRKTRPQATDVRGNKIDWEYPIVCAELCGNQHYQMWGRMTVLDQAQYEKWESETSANYAKGVEEGTIDTDPGVRDTNIFWKYWRLNEKGERIFPEVPKKTAAAH